MDTWVFHLTKMNVHIYLFRLHTFPSHRVDQVLYVEMVLPDGIFVRFGPSTWTPPEGDQLYPQTTSVKGYCIADDTVDLSDESNWNWVDCTTQYDFDGLWFAVRGGSGGSYGVITSIYYQLHDKPGNLQSIVQTDLWMPLLSDPSISEEDKGTWFSATLRFLFNFLYNPDRVGVTTAVSNSCSAADNGVLQCYNGAGQAFVDAFHEYFRVLKTANMLHGTIPTIQFEEYPSYFATEAPLTFNGRVPDGPKGQILFESINPMVVPIDVIQNKFDEFMDIFERCYLNLIAFTFGGGDASQCMTGLPYFNGGGIQYASDGTDAYPPHRRNGAFQFVIFNDDETTKQIKRLLWDVPEEAETFSEGDFPGIFCHNHLFYSTSPKKNNWLIDCNERSGTPLSDDDCMSLQEAAFGTETLRRLEKIHSSIDPLRMFQTSDGPGYADDEGDAGTSSAGTYLSFISCFIALLTTCTFYSI